MVEIRPWNPMAWGREADLQIPKNLIQGEEKKKKMNFDPKNFDHAYNKAYAIH